MIDDAEHLASRLSADRALAAGANAAHAIPSVPTGAQNALKINDLVRVVVDGVVKAVPVGSGTDALMAFIEPHGARNGEGFAVTQLGHEHLPSVSVEIVTPAEEWRGADVVRNASDPHDGRAWSVDVEFDAEGWRFHLLGDPARLWRRCDLPPNLVRLVDGQTGHMMLAGPTEGDLDAIRMALTETVGPDLATSSHGLREIVAAADGRRGVIRRD